MDAAFFPKPAGYRAANHRPSLFTVSLSIAAVAYVVAAGVLVLGLWFYYDLRDSRMYDRERRQTMFHCIRCDQLYTAPAGAETCVCPRCGFRNARLTF